MATLFFDFDGTVADSEAGIVAALKYICLLYTSDAADD